MIKITNKAQEKINSIERKEEEYLRIYVQGGGCSGMQYKFAIDVKDETDNIIKNCLIVDPLSFQYLDGSELDYKTSLEGDLFTISNPNAKSTCGCGESFGI